MKKFVAAHKLLTMLACVLVAGAGYAAYARMTAGSAAPRYVIARVQHGTIVTSVSGSGQVEPTDQIDAKPKLSADVVAVYVKQGDRVKRGDVLARLDATDAQAAVTQAELNLQSAKIALAKLQEAPTALSLAQAQDAAAQAQSAITSASSTLGKAYQDGFNAITAAFVDMQSVMTGLQDFVTGTELSGVQGNASAYVNLMPLSLQPTVAAYQNSVAASYQTALASYQKASADYQPASRSSDHGTLDALFGETYDALRDISNAVKAGQNMMSSIQTNYPKTATPLPAMTATFQTNMTNYTTTVNADLGSVAGARNTVATDVIALNTAQMTLTEKNAALAQLQSGPDALDVQSSQLAVRQRELDLQTAQAQLADAAVRAPLGGIVSAVDATSGEAVSPSTVVASIIGQDQLATVTLNESDVAKVRAGDKATLTFNAIDGLSIAGTIAAIDLVGTVSQGVVSYNIQIDFAAQNSAVKPGMSVTANIVTDVRQNVLVVPSAAVKTAGNVMYVLAPQREVPDGLLQGASSAGVTLADPPKEVPITLGLSSDSTSEVLTGLSEGDEIIVKTVTASAKNAVASQTQSSLRIPNGFFGGGVLRGTGR